MFTSPIRNPPQSTWPQWFVVTHVILKSQQERTVFLNRPSVPFSTGTYTAEGRICKLAMTVTTGLSIHPLNPKLPKP